MKVIFVDDDTNLINSFRRMAFALPGFEASFATDGEQALEIMAAQEFDAIVSDMRMPGMDGATLLARVRRSHPDMVRFVLSGHSGHDLILRSLPHAHQFLSKPCSIDKIMAELHRVHVHRQAFQNLRIRALVCGLGMPPVTPKGHAGLRRALEAQECSLAHVETHILKDAGLSAGILKLVNSSFFGMPPKCTTPHGAIYCLGIDLLRNIVLDSNTFEDCVTEPHDHFSLGLLGHHCLNTAMLCREICSDSAPEIDPETTYTAGLLHDIGKLVLASEAQDEYARVLHLVRTTEMTICQAEEDVFGVTHAEVGAYLLRLWGFQETIIAAIAGHHRMVQSQEHIPLAQALHVANVLEHELVHINENYTRPRIDDSHLSTGFLNPESYARWRSLTEGIELVTAR